MLARLSVRAQTALRLTLLIGFVASWGLVAVWRHGPRAFWTGFFPLLPLAIVVIGFHTWRQLCPLAFFTQLGARLPRSKQRRVPAFFEKQSYVVSLGILAVGLAVRLLFINGDGIALAVFLAAISLAAFVVGVVFTGKTWCNFFCPVGIVEKIYTEPSNLHAHGNSQCPKCTACKKHCPDIDSENHYWKEFESPARRTAYFAFPGLVWGFYTAFALPRGTLDDYFSGRWTHVPHQYALATAPGLFFLPGIPRVVAMPLHLAVCMALSFVLFTAVHGWIARRTEPARARHVTFALAAFVAFTSFYVFAGQPLYRHLGAGLPVLTALATTLVATLMLARRWARSEDDYVQERSVKKILAKWPYDEPPPKDPREVFAFVKSKERERDKILAMYADAIRDVLSDGVVDQSEHRMLEMLRGDFGISKSEHDKVLARLSSEDQALFDPAHATSVERRVQEQGYRLALQNLLPTRPREREIEALRSSYGIDVPTHQKILAELRSDDSPLRLRAMEQLDALDRLRETMADVGAMARVRAFQWLMLVMLRRQRAAISRTLELTGVRVGDAPRMHALGVRLFGEAHEVREQGLAGVQAIDPVLAERLRPAVMQRKPPVADLPDGKRLAAVLDAQVHGGDPMLAAAALVCVAVSRPASLVGTLGPLLVHTHPLVREAAALAASMVAPEERALLEPLTRDPDARVVATTTALLREADAPRPAMAAELTTRAAANLLATTRDGRAKVDVTDFTTLPTPERMLVLATIPLFADLEPEQLYDLAVLAGERVVPGDAPLCREGEPGDEVFVVIAGRGEVFCGEGDTRTVLGAVAGGDCVGELAVLDEAPRAATVWALEPLRVLVIEGGAFRALLTDQPDLAEAVIAMITRRLRSTLARVPARVSAPGG